VTDRSEDTDADETNDAMGTPPFLLCFYHVRFLFSRQAVCAMLVWLHDRRRSGGPGVNGEASIQAG
jgi:hypothetical protein